MHPELVRPRQPQTQPCGYHRLQLRQRHQLHAVDQYARRTCVRWRDVDASDGVSEAGNSCVVGNSTDVIWTARDSAHRRFVHRGVSMGTSVSSAAPSCGRTVVRSIKEKIQGHTF